MSCVDKDWQNFSDTSVLHEGLSHVPVYLNTDVRCNFCFSAAIICSTGGVQSCAF